MPQEGRAAIAIGSVYKSQIVALDVERVLRPVGLRWGANVSDPKR